MAVLEHLEPKAVFGWFEEICAIPHGSGHTDAISAYLVRFAAERGLRWRQDEMGNVIIWKAAAAGYEAAPPVILQGHMDMVCEKTADCIKDMDAEGLDLVVEGDTVYACGTTLGGDDGIAVAMILALLDSHDLPHPALEAVLTVDEEVGMLGAAGINLSDLRGRSLINIDSEVEGVFTAGCAGGGTATIEIPVKRNDFIGTAIEITVRGLVGGHSGIEIHKGRANADVLLGRVLRAIQKKAELRLVSVEGGLKDNAIPAAARAVLIAADTDAAAEACSTMQDTLRAEYAAADAGLQLDLHPVQTRQSAMDAESTRRVLCFLLCAPNGVQEMSRDIEGLVQTSLNLGILCTDGQTVTASYSVRSSMESQKQMLFERLNSLAERLGGKLSLAGVYPAWQYRRQSPLRERMTEIFIRQYGHAPVVEIIHAGLECGLLSEQLEGLDCVSIGPDLTEIHTPRERMHIASVGRTWSLLTETLKQMR